MSICITGGSGFFGRVLVAHLLRSTSVERICIYSRNEHAQAAMRAALAPEDVERLRFFIGDVRDLQRLRRAFVGCQYVVHAAALKRVEVGEYCPDELARTNVLGSINVIDAARDAGVQKCVLVSSDKACQPLNAYGASKLLAEKLFRAAGDAFCVVRYGNVAGSTGSVIPQWRESLIAGRRPVLTDLDMSRYWMDAMSAATLVLWALEALPGGQLAVPILSAYRLGDLAEALQSVLGSLVWFDRRVPIPGEKRHESMICEAEVSGFSLASNGKYWMTGAEGQALDQPLVSSTAPRLSIDELVIRLREFF